MNMRREQNREKGRAALRFDVILISGLLLISLVLLSLWLIMREEGGIVTVEIGGEKVAEYSLLIDGEYSLNGGTNILVIENGEAYLSYADCPDHTCVRTGKIKYTGQSISCLPNRLSVTVRSAQDEVDLIS